MTKCQPPQEILELFLPKNDSVLNPDPVTSRLDYEHL